MLQSPERVHATSAPPTFSRRHGGDWTLWAIVATIAVHITEEYALNFPAWSARALATPVTWEDFHLVNFGVIVYAIACAAVGWRMPALGLSAASLVIVNAIGFHLGFTIATGLYSPGTVSAVVLFVPSGFLAYALAWRAGVLTRRALLWSAAIGVLWHLFLGGVFYVKYFSPIYP